MTVDFCDHFWGEKCNGFDILYHNMKYGQIASKELAEFFRERCSIEEAHSKFHNKLAKQAGNCNTNGTFAPVWQILKSSSEKLSTYHQQMVQKFQELIKEVLKYCEEQHKKHKLVKDEEAATLEVVQSIQSTTGTLIKAKEIYNQRWLEYEKLKRDNATPKEIEKAEVKYRKAGEDYKTLVEKYSNIREDFDKKMTITCRHFQDVEQDHLRKMKLFLQTYSQVLQTGHSFIGQVHIEFQQQCEESTVEKLFENFIEAKATGIDRPAYYEFRWEGPIEFEEADLSSLSGLSTSGDTGDRATNGEKAPKKEGNKGLSSLSGKSKSKPSRRTTSLLNLFLPSSHGNHHHQHPERPISPFPTSPVIANGSNSDLSLSRNTFRGSKSEGTVWHSYWNSTWKPGFLKSRREKKQKKKRNETPNKDQSSDKEIERKDDSGGPTALNEKNMAAEVDDEGFTIRPQSESRDADKGSFYSSSGSDTDEEKEKKIHIEIKPLTNGSAPLSASIDELRASVGGLVISPAGGYNSLYLSRLPPHAPSLSPRGHTQRHRPHDLTIKSRRTPTNELDSPMKRSVSQQIGKPSNDLLGLSFVQSPAASSASTPTGAYGGSTSSPTSTGTGASIPSPTSVGSGGKRSEDSTPTPTPTKYEELGDLFSGLGDLPPALPPKNSSHHHQQHHAVPTSSNSSRSTPTSLSSIAIPRPTSRPRVESAPLSRASPISPMSRADSVSSLSSDFRSSSMSVGSSRGPSPLTIGMSDTIPLAIAFQESVHAYFQGTDETKCQVKLVGDMMFSFPAGIIQVLANNPLPAILSFRLKNVRKLDQVVANKQLISESSLNWTGDSNHVFEFNMAALTAMLRRQAEQNPAASYFNVDILKYQIRALPYAQSTPLQLVAYWKCEQSNTDLRVDYKYNGAAMTVPLPLLNLNILVPVDGGVTAMQSKPNGTWIAETQRAVWRFTEMSQHSDNSGMGSIRARFELKSGPSCPGTIAAQFSCEGTTLSGAEFELVGTGYRISLIKRRFITGKYICEAEPDMKNRYAPPP